MIEWFDDVAVPPLSVKIESRSNSPSFSQHATVDISQLISCTHNETLSTKSQPVTQSHKTSSKTGTCRPDGACCPHSAAVKAVASHCTSARPVTVRRRQSRSRSRTPTTAPHPSTSRSHHSRRSVDVKTECTTPVLHKKSSRFRDYLLIELFACSWLELPYSLIIDTQLFYSHYTVQPV